MSLSVGRFEWSLGNANSGYPTMLPGRIHRIGLSVSNRDIQVEVSITVNGLIPESVRSYIVTKLYGCNSGFRVFSAPIELSAGDRINFQTSFLYDEKSERINSIPDVDSIIALLIELINFLIICTMKSPVMSVRQNKNNESGGHSYRL